MKLLFTVVLLVTLQISSCNLTTKRQELLNSTSSGVLFFGDAAQYILSLLKKDLTSKPPAKCQDGKPDDCGDLPKRCPSGVYKIYPRSSPGFNVFCDMDIDGGGWTVFQRRINGFTNFYRGWDAYKNGFGDLHKEFWLGNRNIHKVTSQASFELRIDLTDWDGNSRFAKYHHFVVGRESTNFVLGVSGYYGTAGDGFSYNNGMGFSTKDRDNGSNCAKRKMGAWWYKTCGYVNLNGQYFIKTPDADWKGIYWYQWKGNLYSMKATVMMMRRALD